METSFKRGLGGFVVLNVVCLFLVPARAGVEIGPNVIVEPGGIEVPLLVNVLGPEDPGDVDEVREIIYEANLILQRANVQLSVSRLYTGIMVGDGDRRISAVEGGEVLLGSLFELAGTYIPSETADDESMDDAEMRRHRGLGKGVKLNIADDTWVEEPDRVYLDWGVLPVAFLERAGSPQETARNLVYGLALTLRVPGSPDPANLMYTGGTGTALNSGQADTILEGVRPIGLERSSIAEGFAPDLLWRLYYGRSRGTLFNSEGYGATADLLGDVFYDHAGDSGFGLGDVDLAYLDIRTGSPLTPIEQRSLTLKAVLYTTDFPLSGGVDVYLAALEPDDDRKSVDPQDFFSEAELILGFGKGYAGYVKTGGDGQWNPLGRATSQTTVVGAFSLLKTEILYSDLRSAMSDSLYEALTSNGRVRFTGTANSYSYDGTNFSFEDDAMETTAVAKPVPKPLPTISPDARITSPGTGMPGLWAWGGKAEQPFEVTRDNVHDFKRDFFGGAIPLIQQGTRTSAHVNFYDSSDNTGAFDRLNGFADETFPGIDDFATSPGNPAGGDDDDYFGVQIITVVDFPAGLSILGVNVGDNMGFCLDVGGRTVGHSFRGLFPQDEAVNGFAQPDGDENDDLPRHLYAFLVEQPARYAVHLQALHTNGGASLELHDVRPSGDCLLAGDTANGGLFFEEPSQEVIDQILAGDLADGGPDDNGNGGDGTDGGDGGTNGTSDQILVDFEDSISIALPFRTFGDQQWSINTVDDNRFARSGSIADNEVTSLEATLDVGAGDVVFDYWVSSENNFDFLRFYIDDVERQAWSGEKQGMASFPVEAGAHVFRWDFAKDGSAASGLDAAWIDNLAYPVP